MWWTNFSPRKWFIDIVQVFLALVVISHEGNAFMSQTLVAKTCLQHKHKTSVVFMWCHYQSAGEMRFGQVVNNVFFIALLCWIQCFHLFWTWTNCTSAQCQFSKSAIRYWISDSTSHQNCVGFLLSTCMSTSVFSSYRVTPWYLCHYSPID